MCGMPTFIKGTTRQKGQKLSRRQKGQQGARKGQQGIAPCYLHLAGPLNCSFLACHAYIAIYFMKCLYLIDLGAQSLGVHINFVQMYHLLHKNVNFI